MNKEKVTMKKQLIALTLALGLGSASIPAFAGDDDLGDKKQPVKMTDQQMDDVTAGAILIGLSVRNSSASGAQSFAASGSGSVAAASAYSRSRSSVRLTLIAF
jgi:hypothetical protein